MPRVGPGQANAARMNAMFSMEMYCCRSEAMTTITRKLGMVNMTSTIQRIALSIQPP